MGVYKPFPGQVALKMEIKGVFNLLTVVVNGNPLCTIDAHDLLTNHYSIIL